MSNDWEQYDLYRLLKIDPGAGVSEIEEAHKRMISELNPDDKPDDQKRDAALIFTAVEAARATLSEEKSRKPYDEKLNELRQAESAKEKIETKRKGKLQEQQSIEEDERLKKAVLKYEAAKDAVADFYYNRLFSAARGSHFETVSPEEILGWLNSKREESARQVERKGRRVSFEIDWNGFSGVQESRKKRKDEVLQIVEGLLDKLETM